MLRSTEGLEGATASRGRYSATLIDCTICGVKIKAQGGKRRYCKPCAADVIRQRKLRSSPARKPDTDDS